MKLSVTDDVLEQIRALLVLLAIKGGVATSQEVGRVLGVDGSTIRHLLSGPKAKTRARRKK